MRYEGEVFLLKEAGGLSRRLSCHVMELHQGGGTVWAGHTGSGFPTLPGLSLFLVSMAFPVGEALGQFAGPHQVTLSLIFPRAGTLWLRKEFLLCIPLSPISQFLPLLLATAREI